MKKYDCIRLEPAKGGYILKYMKNEANGESKFANSYPTDVTEVFTDEHLGEAMAKMKFLNSEE